MCVRERERVVCVRERVVCVCACVPERECGVCVCECMRNWTGCAKKTQYVDSLSVSLAHMDLAMYNPAF